MTLATDEVLRRSLDRARDRFLLHMRPAGFVDSPPCGFLAPRGRTGKLARCRALLAVPAPAPMPPEPVARLLFRLTGVDITKCPRCRTGHLRRSTGLTAGLVAVFRPSRFPAPALDTA